MKEKYISYRERGILECQKVVSEVYTKSSTKRTVSSSSVGYQGWFSSHTEGSKSTKITTTDLGYVMLGNGRELPVSEIEEVSDKPIQLPTTFYELTIMEEYRGAPIISFLLKFKNENEADRWRYIGNVQYQCTGMIDKVQSSLDYGIFEEDVYVTRRGGCRNLTMKEFSVYNKEASTFLSRCGV